MTSLNVLEGFAHLHVHSHGTLLGGTASVQALVERAADDGMPSLALTDTNVLYGAVALDRACREIGIRPIIGMTVTVAMPPDLGAPLDAVSPGRVVLLATGLPGYRSLCRLSSVIQASPERERIAARGVEWGDLKAHREGIICLEGGRVGWVSRCLRARQLRAAQRYAGRLAGIYGENAYLCLELGRDGDSAVAQETVSIGSLLGVPIVAVQPVYCLSQEESSRFRLLAAIDLNCSLGEVPARALPNGGDPNVDVHWLSPDEMAERYAAFPEALANVKAVAARCERALPDNGPYWPTVDYGEGQTADGALADLAREGLRKRYGPELAQGHRERLERELEAISRHGYAPLFLVVADIVRFARESDIPISTRGSVANSLVAYCSGITTVDPIAHDLLFERFLSPARADMPDIDLDLCSRRRDEVLAYVRRVYGADRVAMVAVVSTMGLRSAVRETAKAHRVDEEAIARLVKRLPRGWHPDPRRRDTRPLSEVLGDVDDPALQGIVQEATQIVGLPHHLSIHPGGVVIAPGPLTDILPVQWAAKGFLITQFDHRDVEALGLPKIDLLGIRALSVLAGAVALIRRDHDPGFGLAEIPIDDQRTGDLLSRAETVGVFQCESQGARSTLQKLRARTVRDLAVANAFFKPGPSTGGMARTFVRRYRGEEEPSYLHPSLEPILGPTKGVLIFQEQILRVAIEIAGLGWEQADHLRRGMSKFRAQEMKDLEAQFVTGCQRGAPDGPGFTAEQAQRLWEQVVPFSGFGFNQGHATAYAQVSYQSAYIKAHYPAALLCARLANWGGFHHPAMYVVEAIRMGIAVRPPHVNHSERAVSLVWDDGNPVLWLGLGRVRDLRRDAVREIVAQRDKRPFEGLRDLMRRVCLHSMEAVHLVQCGALDGFGASRSALLTDLEEVRRAGTVLQMTFSLAGPDIAPESADQRAAWERQVLGYPVSSLRSPVPSRAYRSQHCVPLHRLDAFSGQLLTVSGVRLPGWTGGRGFHLWDGQTWVLARGARSLQVPSPWTPFFMRGRWVSDEWGTKHLEVGEIRVLSQP